jgi:hypothetical protein
MHCPNYAIDYFSRPGLCYFPALYVARCISSPDVVKCECQDSSLTFHMADIYRITETNLENPRGVVQLLNILRGLVVRPLSKPLRSVPHHQPFTSQDLKNNHNSRSMVFQNRTPSHSQSQRDLYLTRWHQLYHSG